MWRDDATRAKQESVGEVEEVGFHAGAEWAECGGVLPRPPAVCAASVRALQAVKTCSRVSRGYGVDFFAACGMILGSSSNVQVRWVEKARSGQHYRIGLQYVI